jgi:hypothetical protein
MSNKKKANHAPLIVESHPSNYTGYDFVTLIQYNNNKSMLTIVDNSNTKSVGAYVLDLCNPEGIDEQWVLDHAIIWNSTYKHKYPLSIYFSINSISGDISKIYRKFNIDFISRVIGPLPFFDMKSSNKIIRRKKKNI